MLISYSKNSSDCVVDVGGVDEKVRIPNCKIWIAAPTRCQAAAKIWIAAPTKVPGSRKNGMDAAPTLLTHADCRGTGEFCQRPEQAMPAAGREDHRRRQCGHYRSMAASDEQRRSGPEAASLPKPPLSPADGLWIVRLSLADVRWMLSRRHPHPTHRQAPSGAAAKEGLEAARVVAAHHEVLEVQERAPRQDFPQVPRLCRLHFRVVLKQGRQGVVW